MRRKISAILVTALIMLMVMPMGAFAAVPSVQEVETLIAQIGTVTRENRSAVEKAVNAYNQLDDASIKRACQILMCWPKHSRFLASRTRWRN